MDRRFLLFLVAAWLTIVGYGWLVQFTQPPKPRPVAAKQAEAPKPDAKDAAKPADDATKDEATKKVEPLGNEKTVAEKQADTKSAKPAVEQQIKAVAEPEAPEQWVTLGSADETSPYRMLVTLTNKGAAIARVELSSGLYRDVDDRSGYLGHMIISGDGTAPGGCRVQIVGPGTPAAEAGMKNGDVIQSINGKPVSDTASLNKLLARTKPGQTIQILVQRDGKDLPLAAKLRRRPLEVIRPEDGDPLSMLLTLNQVDQARLAVQSARDLAIYRLYVDLKLSDKEVASLDGSDVELDKDKGRVRLPAEAGQERSWADLSAEARNALADWKTRREGKSGPLFVSLDADSVESRLSAQQVRGIITRVRAESERQLPVGLTAELEGVNLRHGTWKIVEQKADRVVFRRTLPQWGLEVTKFYRLVQVPQEAVKNAAYPAYHLVFDVEVKNVGGKTHAVAYRLDGPNGLPTEGAWYSSRVTRSGGSGLRDFVISLNNNTPGMVGAMTLATDAALPPWQDQGLSYVGVDAQYFSAVLMPQRQDPNEVWFDQLLPIRVGKVHPEHHNLTNTSCRLISKTVDLKAGGTLAHRFHLFAGPKKQALLDNPEYRLGELIYFGWPIFAIFAVPLTWFLHVFYAVVWNYGLAIIMLTVLVRGLMFPLSIKQALGAQKMQLLQPEMKKLQEKHKNDRQAMAKAQQELFRKHNYNPLAGCLPIFIQLPVFMGLYRSLMVAIELRDAPLISHAVRWCSNLAAPDMLWNWSPFMPAFVNSGVGIFGLGPYFNVLPLLTIVLFLWQQKKMTPPPADEQAAMQQKIMQAMMVFMGLLFFKVPSGLCIYFVASSLWGLGERRFLPKMPTVAPAGPETRAEAKARARQPTKGKK